jgi:hypothetical protein
MKLAPHHYFLSAAFLGVLLSCSGDSPAGAGPTEAGPTPAQIQATAGSGQTGVTETPLATALVARVTDRRGRPVAGVAVTWSAAPGAGTLSATATPTDSTGEASARWTLGSGTGTFTVTASAGGLAPATFTATATPPPVPERVEKSGGDGQTGVVGAGLADPLAVRVVAADGRPVRGVPVSWRVVVGGTLSDTVQATDAEGVSRVRWTLGTYPGVLGVEARVPGLAGSPVVFRATAGPGSPARMERIQGDGQSGSVGLELSAPLWVQVRDRYGNAVSNNTRVEWATAAGGTLYGPGLNTFSDGLAAATWKLGPGEGPQTATATAGGLTVEFTATARPFAPVASVDVGGDVTFGEGRDYNAAATLRDAAGNVLGGRTVTWSTSAPAVATVRSAGGTLASVSPLAAGRATITATSEGRSGSFTLTVVPGPKLTGFARTPASVDVTSAAAAVEFTVSATDPGPGLRQVYVTLRTEAGRTIGGCEADSPASGSRTNGVWKCTHTIGPGAEPGTWVVSTVGLLGSFGTQSSYYGPEKLGPAGYPWTVIVNNSGPLATQPAVTGLSLAPATVDVTHSSATLDVRITAAASAGVRSVSVSARHGSGSGFVFACTEATLVGGTDTNGTWKCPLQLPTVAAPGTWTITTVWVSDRAGNGRSYSAAELAAMGLPTTFQVTRAGS